MSDPAPDAAGDVRCATCAHLWPCEVDQLRAALDDARARLDAVLAVCDRAERRRDATVGELMIADAVRRAATGVE
jgi:hypothetical protein